jgi:hypothetical protein
MIGNHEFILANLRANLPVVDHHLRRFAYDEPISNPRKIASPVLPSLSLSLSDTLTLCSREAKIIFALVLHCTIKIVSNPHRPQHV